MSTALNAYLNTQADILGVSTHRMSFEGYTGGGIAHMAHAMLRSGRKVQSSRAGFESPSDFPRTLDAVSERAAYLSEGCKCATCLVYGGDCPNHDAIVERARYWRRIERRILRAESRGTTPSKLIRTTYEVVTEESAAEGEAEERGWIDEDGTEFTVTEAIEKLEGCEPSSSAFHPGVGTHKAKVSLTTRRAPSLRRPTI